MLLSLINTYRRLGGREDVLSDVTSENLCVRVGDRQVVYDVFLTPVSTGGYSLSHFLFYDIGDPKSTDDVRGEIDLLDRARDIVVKRVGGMVFECSGGPGMGVFERGKTYYS